jgi:hypothetical protein
VESAVSQYGFQPRCTIHNELTKTKTVQYRRFGWFVPASIHYVIREEYRISLRLEIVVENTADYGTG